MLLFSVDFLDDSPPDVVVTTDNIAENKAARSKAVAVLWPLFPPQRSVSSVGLKCAVADRQSCCPRHWRLSGMVDVGPCPLLSFL